jgi:hypothetical protein
MHPQMKLVANSEQKFNLWSRRLITMEKLGSTAKASGDGVAVGEKMPAHAGFRRKYFRV